MNQEKFDRQWLDFVNQSSVDGRFSPQSDQQIPILTEDTGHTEIYADWDYYLHTNWAARVLARTRPARHVDIGSFVYFSSLCSAFLSGFEFYDARPVGFQIPGLKNDSCNLTALHFPSNSIPSLSCLHTIEHVGLGRYGDKVDAEGDVKAAKELMRVLAPGGRLLMVVPMNEAPRINFNAHRIYCSAQIMEMFSGLNCESDVVLTAGVIVACPLTHPNSDYTACFEFRKP